MVTPTIQATTKSHPYCASPEPCSFKREGVVTAIALIAIAALTYGLLSYFTPHLLSPYALNTISALSTAGAGALVLLGALATYTAIRYTPAATQAPPAANPASSQPEAKPSELDFRLFVSHPEKYDPALQTSVQEVLARHGITDLEAQLQKVWGNTQVPTIPLNRDDGTFIACLESVLLKSNHDVLEQPLVDINTLSPQNHSALLYRLREMEKSHVVAEIDPNMTVDKVTTLGQLRTTPVERLLDPRYNHLISSKQLHQALLRKEIYTNNNFWSPNFNDSIPFITYQMARFENLPPTLFNADNINFLPIPDISLLPTTTLSSPTFPWMSIHNLEDYVRDYFFSGNKDSYSVVYGNSDATRERSRTIIQSLSKEALSKFEACGLRNTILCFASGSQLKDLPWDKFSSDDIKKYFPIPFLSNQQHLLDETRRRLQQVPAEVFATYPSLFSAEQISLLAEDQFRSIPWDQFQATLDTVRDIFFPLPFDFEFSDKRAQLEQTRARLQTLDEAALTILVPFFSARHIRELSNKQLVSITFPWQAVVAHMRISDIFEKGNKRAQEIWVLLGLKNRDAAGLVARYLGGKAASAFEKSISFSLKMRMWAISLTL